VQIQMTAKVTTKNS